MGADWMTPIISYLRNGTLTEDCNAPCMLKVQSSRFIKIGDVLYKRGFSSPYLRCLVPNEVEYVMREAYKGVYGNHSGACLLVHKLI